MEEVANEGIFTVYQICDLLEEESEDLNQGLNESSETAHEQKSITSEARISPSWCCFSLSRCRLSIGERMMVPARRILAAPLEARGVETVPKPISLVINEVIVSGTTLALVQFFVNNLFDKIQMSRE